MEHMDYLNRIGNMAILKESWNTKAGNQLFVDKKKEYAKSEIPLTNELKDIDEWIPKVVEERTNKLFEYADDIWYKQ